MKNSYHYTLTLPVTVTFNETWETTRLSWYDTKHIELVEFLETLGITIRHAQRFYTPPYGTLPIHVDSHDLVSQAKLNYIIGGKDSTMDWFELKPGRDINTMVTPVGSKYLYADAGDVVKVYSAKVGHPSIINSGILHSITNSNEPRVCYSFVLAYLDSDQNLSWQDSERLFGAYIDE
jgi:hypothetical protein